MFPVNIGVSCSIRHSDFLLWLKGYDNSLYNEYLDAELYGLWPSWLCYLWSDPEKGLYATSAELSQGVQSVVVTSADARIYCRTAIQCLLQHKSFDSVEIEDFSIDSSPLQSSQWEDGELKLSTLIGVAASLKEPILYIGSGDFRPEQVEAAKEVEIKRVDVVYSEEKFDTLISVDLNYPVVINDAYYEGMEVDQRRLKNVKVYYAKKFLVEPTDFLFYLPGLDEPRYTNDKRFKDFIPYFLSHYMVGCATIQSIVLDWYVKKIPGIQRYLCLKSEKKKEMKNRLFLDVTGRVAVNVKYKEYALAAVEEVVNVDGRSYTYSAVRLFVAENGFSRGFLVDANEILRLTSINSKLKASICRRTKNQVRNKVEKKTNNLVQVEKYQLIVVENDKKIVDLCPAKLNIARLRALITPVENFYHSEEQWERIVASKQFVKKHKLINQQFLWNTSRDSKLYKVENFSAHIDSIVGKKLLLDYECGDGLFSTFLTCNVCQYSEYDHRVSTNLNWSNNFSIVKPDFVLLRFILHKQSDPYGLLHSLVKRFFCSHNNNRF